MPRKGFGEFASAVSDTIYTIYLSLCTHTADQNPLKHFEAYIMYNAFIKKIKSIIVILYIIMWIQKNSTKFWETVTRIP